MYVAAPGHQHTCTCSHGEVESNIRFKGIASRVCGGLKRLILYIPLSGAYVEKHRVVNTARPQLQHCMHAWDIGARARGIRLFHVHFTEPAASPGHAGKSVKFRDPICKNVVQSISLLETPMVLALKQCSCNCSAHKGVARS